MNCNDYIQHFNPYHNPKNGQFAPKTKDERYDKAKKIAKAGAIMVGAAAMTYGGYKLHQFTKINKQSKNLYRKIAQTKATAWAESDMDDAVRLGIKKDFKSLQNKYLKKAIKDSAKDIRKLTIDEFKYQTKFNRRALMDKIKPDMFGSRTEFMRSPMDQFKKIRGL